MAILHPPTLMKFLRCRGLASFEQARGRFVYGTKDKDGRVLTLPFSRAEDTVHRVLQRAFVAYTNLPCLGTRQFVRLHTPEGARFPLKVFGETTWQTYGEVRAEAAHFGSGLRALGLEPMPLEMANQVVRDFKPITGPHCVVVFEDTCAEWTTAVIGCFGQALTVATSYATLGMAAVGEALNQTQAPVIVCNFRDVPRVAKQAAAECPHLRTIVYTRLSVEASEPDWPTHMGDIQTLSFGAVVALGQAQPFAFSEPAPEHVGLIMYTSGSTGKPKGVMLTHSSIVAAAAGLEDYFCGMGSVRATCETDQETYLAYLPAAHILEFAAEMSMLTHGAKMGYSDPKTIASAGALRLMPDGITLNSVPTGFGNYPPGGIQEFAPTVMAAVPKIWDILKKGVEDSVGKGSGVTQALFQAAFTARSTAIQQGRECPLLGLLFKKVGGALGGRMKLGVTGGGPISADVQNFVRVAMHFNLVQGYGLTETCSNGTVQPSLSYADGVAGAPTASVEIRLADCDEREPGAGSAGSISYTSRPYKFVDREKKPYLSSDAKHLGMPCLGRGEVWIRGAAVSSGYYTEATKTREVFDADGWFHTGDVGVWTMDGNLKIVDRLKNLVKLKGGEYVALESMEATYAQSVYVNGKNGGLLCYADGEMDRPVALVQVNDRELQKWADNNGVGYASFEALCADPAARKMVCTDLNTCGRGVLGGNEALAAVALLPGTAPGDSNGPDAPWTPENGYLTAANKLARGAVKEGFEDMLNEVKRLAIR